MKKNIFLKGLAGVLVASAILPAMTSCSSDYLEQTPITSVSKADVANTLDGAKYAMQGLCSSMYRQMSDYTWNSTNGETYMNYMYGEAMGNTYHDRIWNVYASNISDWTQMRTQTSMVANYMWRYCYGLINAANQVLDVIDDVPTTSSSEEAERDFIKAVALTMRGHCYIKLLQVYAPRWQDSNNGSVNSGIVLRLTNDTPDIPFSTTAEVMNQVYTDLDAAIGIFNSTSYNDNLIWTPDVNVAHGLKARAAAIKQDWQTVRSEAKIARQSNPIMTAEEYVKGGFICANNEYMWASWFQSEGIYYWAHGTIYSCNGPNVWGWGVSSAIDFDLYRKIPATDCRKGLYLAPGFLSLPANKDLAEACGVNDDSFFDSTIVDASSVRVNVGTNKSMVNFINKYALDDEHWPDWSGSMPLASSFTDGNPYPYYGASYLVAGLQYKFWSVDTYGTNQMPFMRASEMAYLEAEAACMLGDDSGAQAIMIEINKDKRDPNFTCTETGQALLEKVRAYRQIELWGEGFTWFDLKRWNVTMHRSEWIANDPTSGNYQKNLAKDFAPDAKCGWRASVPSAEFSYNRSISVDELPDNNR